MTESAAPTSLWSRMVAVPAPPDPPDPVPFTSALCKQRHFELALYPYWCRWIREEPRFHRKQWEFVYILQSLHERGLLAAGRRGLGFGVGGEPLAAVFASLGCEVVGSDLSRSEAASAGWNDPNYVSDLESLNQRGICSPDLFRARVGWRRVDMRHIPGDLTGFDFCWSSCALEHLGSLELGARFIHDSLDCLKPGGVAVHTTEFNCSSSDHTLTSGDTVLFRRQDIGQVVDELRREGHTVEEVDDDPGDLEIDRIVDPPPYRGEPHLKLELAGFVATSIGLIIRKGA